jgi:hypothetical protein
MTKEHMTGAHKSGLKKPKLLVAPHDKSLLPTICDAK